MKVISWDGGGQLGVIGARLVERIDGERPGFADSADLLAGTSVGSINAASRAIKLKPAKVTHLFRSLGAEVFKSRGKIDDWTPDEVVRADYSLGPLVDLLQREIGPDVALMDVGTRLLVPTFCMERWGPKYLDETDSWPLWAACAASSAAPTFFPSFEGPDGLHYVDGGMFDNSPSASAVDRASKLGAATHEIRCLSIGTGRNPRSETGGDWGYRQWLKGARLLNLLFDAMGPKADYQCAQRLGRYDPRREDHDPEGRYLRLEVDLPDEIAMDDPSRVDDLLAIADAVDLSWVTDWIDQHWERAA